MTMGEKIFSMRKARGWSQEELAERVGVTRQAVSRWEADSAKPDADNILVLCDLFGISADYLLREQYSGEGAVPQKKETALGAFIRELTLKQWAWSGVCLISCMLLLGLRLVYLFSDMSYTYSTDQWVYTGYVGFLWCKDMWGIWNLAWGGAVLSVVMLFWKQLKEGFMKLLKRCGIEV